MRMELTLVIDCEEKTCGNCQYKTVFYAGPAGEFHPKCGLFEWHVGEWGRIDMNRCQSCKAKAKATKEEKS